MWGDAEAMPSDTKKSQEVVAAQDAIKQEFDKLWVSLVKEEADAISSNRSQLSERLQKAQHLKFGDFKAELGCLCASLASSIADNTFRTEGIHKKLTKAGVKELFAQQIAVVLEDVRLFSLDCQSIDSYVLAFKCGPSVSKLFKDMTAANSVKAFEAGSLQAIVLAQLAARPEGEDIETAQVVAQASSGPSAPTPTEVVPVEDGPTYEPAVLPPPAKKPRGRKAAGSK